MTDLPKSHFVSDDLFNRAIRIHLIGCGGTGSQLAPRLVQLHKALLALGHPEGLQVSLWDSDTVSESNPLRQNYFDIDVGHLKAVVMTNRINIAFGMDWKARPEHFTGEVRSVNDRADIVIGCVDTKSSRRAIDQFVRTQGTPCYWIDSGLRTTQIVCHCSQSYILTRWLVWMTTHHPALPESLWLLKGLPRTHWPHHGYMRGWPRRCATGRLIGLAFS